MKHLIFILMMAAIPASATETERVVEGLERTIKLAYCEEVGELGEIIMTGRQRGETLQRLLDIAEKNEPPISDLMITMIRYAWLLPVYDSPEQKTRLIKETKERFHLQCLDAAL